MVCFDLQKILVMDIKQADRPIVFVPGGGSGM